MSTAAGPLRRDAPITAHDTATRTLTVQLAAWDQPRLVHDPGRPPYWETHARDSLVPRERLYVLDQHFGQLIGRADPPYDAGVGPASQVHIAHTRAGDDLLALIDAEVIRDVSIEFAPEPGAEVWNADHTAVTRTRSHLAGIAFAFAPQHSAPILAREAPTMPDQPATTTPPAGADDDELTALLRALQPPSSTSSTSASSSSGAPAGAGPVPPPAPPAPPPVPNPPPASPGTSPGMVALADQVAAAVAARSAPAPGTDALQAELTTLRSAVTTLVTRQIGPPRPRYGTWGALIRGAAAGELSDADTELLRRALVDITTADVPGLIPRPELARIFQIISAAQPFVEALGSAPLPDAGMTVDYPRVDQRPSVGVQAAEKTDIVSAETKVSRQSAPVVTFAGGEDVSIQAILRSSPSYLELMGRLYAEAMAIATSAYAYSIYAAAVPALHKVSIGIDPVAWVTELAELAGLVLTDARVLPNRLVLSTDLWVKFTGAHDTEGRPLFPNTAPANPVGEASLGALEGNVRGLRWVVDPGMPADRGALFYADAAVSMLGPVQTLTADNVAKLGRDYAVFRFGSIAAVNPQGLALFSTGVAPTAAEGEAGEDSEPRSTRKR